MLDGPYALAFGPDFSTSDAAVRVFFKKSNEVLDDKMNWNSW